MRTTVIFGIVISILFGVFAPAPPFSGPALALAQSCNARENLQEVAVSFIQRCCQGSIYRVSPTQLSFATLGEIQRGTTWDHKKAWKLLNSNRFKK